MIPDSASDERDARLAQLLDELTVILRSPSESVDIAAVKAVESVVREGTKQAKTVRRAGRMAKREAAQPPAPKGKAIASEALKAEAENKTDWWTPARIEPRRRLSETATAVRKRNRRRVEALADAQRADLVRELREQGLNADQIEAEIANRQGHEAGR